MEEEISLKEIIDTLLKGIKTIVIVTLVLTLLAGAFSKFFLTPSYETNATILVNSVNQEDISGEYASYLNEAVSPQIMQERLTSLDLLTRVADKLDVEDLDARDIQRNLTVELAEDSEMIDMTYSGTDPQQMQEILNTVIDESIDYTSETITERLTTLTEDYKQQAEVEKESLDELLVEYNDIRATEGLPTIVIMDAVTSSSNQFVIDTEEIQEFDTLDRNKQVEFEKINSKITSLTNMYNRYYNNYEEGRSLLDVYQVENKFSILAQPYEPENPVSPNVMLNTAIAFVLGLMLSVGWVFLREYWKEASKTEK
ncbi:Wzz/FepE/Etk N-terminal domain-containing protein [Aquibacillus sediminis]|uniref:Wzz/FepE/Etk N-terminal domain-containing protein n=1 Tax=Aquibacillus sediminis TaxID=2574734 RepID=UPI001486929E|nr:Wzz/FepE/Etk N-terminal domain-containing protein [Aquibacillus sediminis]